MMLGNLVGITVQKKLYIPLGGFCSVIGSLLPANPNLLNLIYLSVQEVCLPENRGEIIGPLLHKHASVGQMVGSPGNLVDHRILGEGLPMALPEQFHKGPSLFPLLMGMFFLGDV